MTAHFAQARHSLQVISLHSIKYAYCLTDSRNNGTSDENDQPFTANTQSDEYMNYLIKSIFEDLLSPEVLQSECYSQLRGTCRFL